MMSRAQPPHGHASDRAALAALARRVMTERGLEPAFPPAALAEVEAMKGPATGEAKDLRELLWASIDNDDSRDLDQLTVAEPQDDGTVRILVAIADVDATVHRGSPI